MVNAGGNLYYVSVLYPNAILNPGEKTVYGNGAKFEIYHTDYSQTFDVADDPSYHGITGYEQVETDSVVILDLSGNLLWGHAPSPILVFLQAAISFSVAAFLASCSDDSNSWNASEVCPESGRGTFVDERDGQVYKYTTIGDQVWMAENLNYETDYSICYDNGDSDCNFWGRYYSLQENNDEHGKLD